MLDKIEQWIDQTNSDFEKQRICCVRFAREFKEFYPIAFLRQAYFVVVNEIPKPVFPEMHELGLGDFLDMDVHAITYKNTYYILPDYTNNLRLHFHELVHVAQWDILGAANFLGRYITEIQNHSYDDAPLEIMAYTLDAHFNDNGGLLDVPSYVSENL